MTSNPNVFDLRLYVNNNGSQYYPRTTDILPDMPDIPPSTGIHLKVDAIGSGLIADTTNTFALSGNYSELTDVDYSNRVPNYALIVNPTSDGITYRDIPGGVEPPPEEGILLVSSTLNPNIIIDTQNLYLRSGILFLPNSQTVTQDGWTLSGSSRYTPDVSGYYDVTLRILGYHALQEIPITNGSIQFFFEFKTVTGQVILSQTVFYETSLLPINPPDGFQNVEIIIPTSSVFLSVQPYQVKLTISMFAQGNFNYGFVQTLCELNAKLSRPSDNPDTFLGLDDVLLTTFTDKENQFLTVNSSQTGIINQGMVIEEIPILAQLGKVVNVNNCLKYWYTDKNSVVHMALRPKTWCNFQSISNQTIDLNGGSFSLETSDAITCMANRVATGTLTDDMIFSNNIDDENSTIFFPASVTNCTTYPPGVDSGGLTGKTSNINITQSPLLPTEIQVWGISQLNKGATVDASGLADSQFPAFISLNFNGFGENVYNNLTLRVSLSAICYFLDPSNIGNQTISLVVKHFRGDNQMNEWFDTITLQRPRLSGWQNKISRLFFIDNVDEGDSFRFYSFSYGFGGSIKPYQFGLFQVLFEEV